MFTANRITLLIDPFRTGDDIQTRMRTFDLDAFLLLLSPESWASANVRLELETANRNSIPLFVAKMESPVPEELSIVVLGFQTRQ